MAACGSLQQIFDKPLQEEKKSIQSFKKHIKPKSLDQDSFLFEDFHYTDESPSPLSSLSSLSSSPFSPSSFSSASFSSSSSSSSSFCMDFDPPACHKKEKNDIKCSIPRIQRRQHSRRSDSDCLPSLNSEGGLGLESCEDINEVTMSINDNGLKKHVARRNIIRHKSNDYVYDSNFTRLTLNGYLSDGEPMISRITGEAIPPPITTIGMSGRPWVCFKSYRNNGRFVLKEVRFPTQEFLHSCREDGRLKLQFIQSDEEIIEE